MLICNPADGDWKVVRKGSKRLSRLSSRKSFKGVELAGRSSKRRTSSLADAAQHAMEQKRTGKNSFAKTHAHNKRMSQSVSEMQEEAIQAGDPNRIAFLMEQDKFFKKQADAMGDNGAEWARIRQSRDSLHRGMDGNSAQQTKNTVDKVHEFFVGMNYGRQAHGSVLHSRKYFRMQKLLTSLMESNPIRFVMNHLIKKIIDFAGNRWVGRVQKASLRLAKGEKGQLKAAERLAAKAKMMTQSSGRANWKRYRQIKTAGGTGDDADTVLAKAMKASNKLADDIKDSAKTTSTAAAKTQEAAAKAQEAAPRKEGLMFSFNLPPPKNRKKKITVADQYSRAKADLKQQADNVHSKGLQPQNIEQNRLQLAQAEAKHAEALERFEKAEEAITASFGIKAMKNIAEKD